MQATADSKPGAFLVMGANEDETAASIAQFSTRDASRFAECVRVVRARACVRE